MSVAASVSVLYVEDDLFSREIMSVILKDMMNLTRITILPNSTNFLRTLQALQPPPDIIMLDIHVEPLGGFEMLALVRAEPHFRTTPVVALTASVMNEEVQQLKQAGFSAVLAKPVDQDIFPDLFYRIIKGERIWRVIG